MIASPIIEPISIVRPGHIETDTMVFENTVEKKTATFLIYLGNVEMSKTLDTSLIVTDSSSTVLYPETTPKSKEVVEMDQPDLTRNLQQLEQIANLPNDWNQNGAPSFSDDHIKMVHDLLISLKKQPFIFPTACQSIQIEYEKENEDYLEFEIYSNGSVKEFFCSSNNDIKTLCISVSDIAQEVDRFYGSNIYAK